MAGPSLLIKKRLLFLLIMLTAVVLALTVRIAYIQLYQGEWLQKQAFEQQNKGRTLSPNRGNITDRNGNVLALSASVETIWVSPNAMAKSKLGSEQIAEDLAGLLDMDKAEVLEKITKQVNYQVVKQRIDKEVGNQVRQWREENGIEGIYIDEDTKRYYKNLNLAAHIIGFVGDDNQGLQGIEYIMDRYLKGVPGKILSPVDASQNELPYSSEKRIEAEDGLNVVLTIDETIQYMTQKTLEKAIEDYNVADGAVAIVMDPRNGDILGMVSKPDYDLNDPFAAPSLPDVDPNAWTGRASADDVNLLSQTVWRNKAIMDTYEPGSTFKAITTSAGLEEGVVTPDTMTNDSAVVMSGWSMGCWKSPPHGSETFREAVYNSCNPVFIKVAQSLGINRFYQYVRSFGFYEKTGIELPGETMGIFHAQPTEINMATASFGQRSTITPMQLISAYSAIANSGKLMKPRIIKELRDTDNNIVKKYEPEVVRTVISEKTSKTVLDILEGVVSEGTGRNAYVRGYRVAGKTGTSQTTESNIYVASFAAVAPADNPVVCVLVVLFNPIGVHMGGQIAAPTAGALVEDVLNYLGVERRYTEKDLESMKSDVFVPEVRKKTVEEAVAMLRNFGLEYRVEGEDKSSRAVVVEQTPKPNSSIPEKSVVILYTYEPDNELTVTVPDLLNKTVAEATEALSKAGLNIKVTGMGVAVRQQVAAGESAQKGSVIEVEFRHLDNIE